MKSVQVRTLSTEAFLPYGFYAHLIDPRGIKIGAAPVEFYRDMVQQDLGGIPIASFSICRVEERDPVIDVTECHSKTGEGILPLDSDVLIHVAPASPAGADVPVAKIEVFRVPKGTIVVLRPGVWHHAPFTTDGAANVLIVLPERTYANDCQVVELGEDGVRVVGG